ncbi:MAG TPA: dephospho-CoA kinase [Tetragenococcus sp.]|nr:dephospho-CoA kinase [Tetragenococcus sp.]
MSFILGVTGGIASGKSTVISIFRQWGFPIVDADVIARAVVEPQTPALTKIVSKFGSEILLADGHLDRKKLGTAIFADKNKRRQLNDLLDSYIRTEIVKQVEQLKEQSELVIVDIPLLYERDYDQLVDQVAVVYVASEIQLQRLMKRDQISRSQAQQKIDSQWSLESKKQKADIVFDNQGTVEQTQNQVVEWLKQNHL